MKLKRYVDPAGILWVDNPVVTVRARWDRYRRVLELRPRARRHHPVLRILSVALAILWGALTLYLWYAGELAFDAWTWVLLVASLGVALYDRKHGDHPLYEPAAPVRIGFSPKEMLCEDQDGTVSRWAWSTWESVAIGRDHELSALAHLRGETPVTLRSLNLDLAIMVRWAHHLATTSGLRPESLGQPLAPESEGGGIPEGGITLTEATPPLALYDDRVVLMKRPMHRTFSRADVDAVRFPLLGKERLIITIQDHQASFILDPTKMGRFLDWLGKGDLVVPEPAMEAEGAL